MLKYSGADVVGLLDMSRDVLPDCYWLCTYADDSASGFRMIINLGANFLSLSLLSGDLLLGCCFLSGFPESVMALFPVFLPGPTTVFAKNACWFLSLRYSAK